MGIPLRVGIIGVGNISTQYLTHIPTLPSLKLIALADLDMVRAQEVAAKAGVEARTVDELISSSDIDVILNLTTPGAHAIIGMKALTAGKHVYGEKPLALTVEEAKPMMELAKRSGLRIGSAPDTVLGTGIQTSRDLLDSGRIGKPLAASAFWSAPGHELWHPAPQFYYLPGAGPLFDMGPYYLSALVTLLGPVVSVIGSSTRSDRQRSVATGELAGTELRVEVETHISALLEHASGVSSTIMMSLKYGRPDFHALRSMELKEQFQCQIPICLVMKYKFIHRQSANGKLRQPRQDIEKQGVDLDWQIWQLL